MPLLHEEVETSTWLKWPFALMRYSVKIVVQALFRPPALSLAESERQTAASEKQIAMRISEFKSITPKELFRKKVSALECTACVLMKVLRSLMRRRTERRCCWPKRTRSTRTLSISVSGSRARSRSMR